MSLYFYESRLPDALVVGKQLNFTPYYSYNCFYNLLNTIYKAIRENFECNV